MGSLPYTPSAIAKTLAKDLSLWILIFMHLSVVGLVWYDGWHPLTLLWLYIFQQIVESLLDILFILINPKLNTTGFKMGGKPVTDSKEDRRNSAKGLFAMTCMVMGGFIIGFSMAGMGIPKGTLPLLLYSTGIFAFKKLFAYYYIRFTDGPQPLDAGCMVVAYPVINMFFLTILFFAGNLFTFLPGGTGPRSLPNLLFLAVFITLKLFFDSLVYIAQKYGDNKSTESIELGMNKQ